jgi:hypothetical protein
LSHSLSGESARRILAFPATLNAHLRLASIVVQITGSKLPLGFFVCLKTFRAALPGHRGDAMATPSIISCGARSGRPDRSSCGQVCDAAPRKTVRVWPMIKVKIPGAAISPRLIPPSANGDRSVLGSPVLGECTHPEPSIAPPLLDVLQCSRRRLAIL